LTSTQQTRSPSGRRSRSAVARSALGDLGLALLPLGIVTTATSRVLDLPATYAAVCVVLYLGLGALILRFLPARLPGPGLGAANRVTLGRATLALPVAALLAVPGVLTPVGAWWAVLLAAPALALDGVDGRIARATGTVSPFGGRLDMEIDAFLILALSGLVWTSTPLGPWVVSIGGLRYLFAAAGALWPRLDGPLPPSRRRQAICVVQSVSLLVCLAPVLPPIADAMIAAVALLTLLYSFAVDVAWLARQSATAREGAAR